MNRLFFGDNLDVLRNSVATESVDLIYLDPPFNSKANYNVFFRSTEDLIAAAQAEAFRDTWTWNHEAEWAFDEIARVGGNLATFVNALHSALGRSDLMAYLVMMGIRLHELRRVLKPTGSLYLHCDPTASHYLKLMMDGIFGPSMFRNEIIWKRTGSHSDSKTWGRVSDALLFYSAGKSFTWNIPREAHGQDYLAAKYRHHDGDGRLYQLDNMTSPSARPNMMYEWQGFAFPEKGWRYSRDTMTRLDNEGRIWYPRRADGSPDFSKRPRLKRYLDEMKGGVMGNVWTDIAPLNSQSRERIGYPTQKPAALLERILRASSDPDELVLDPFCGCGTSLHAAQALSRRWVGIDVAYHAVQVISDRIEKHFGLVAGRDYKMEGIPRDLVSAQGLAERDKFQFQWWANYLVGVQQLREVSRGADKGIDGEIFFPAGPGRSYGRILTSVKGGKNVGVSDVRDFRGVLERERADAGLFICLRRPTRDMAQNAASAGFFSVGSSQYPRLQIVSIEEWFEDHARPELPTTGHLARRSAEPMTPQPRPKPRKSDPRQPEFMLPISGSADRRAGDKVYINPRYGSQLTA